MDRLKGKVAVVTGSSMGIGEATARLFAREGAKTVVHSGRSAEAGQRVAEQIRAEGGDAIYVQADVSKAADVQRLLATAVETYGKLDILICNAGICTTTHVADMSEEEYDHVMDTNLKSVFLCTKYAIPYFRQNGGGSIVAMSSRAAFITEGCSAAYCASKAGIIAWMNAVAHEYGKENIRANSVLPSNVWTDMSRAFCAGQPDPEAAARWFDNAQELGRAGTTDELARAILFLASDEASFITSTPLLVDGGFFFNR